MYRALGALPASGASETDSELMGDLSAIIHQVAFQIYSTVKGVTVGEDSLPDSVSPAREFYFELKPIVELLVLPPDLPNKHYLAAPTAHYLMQTFNLVLDYDAPSVLKYAAAVCRAAFWAGISI